MKRYWRHQTAGPKTFHSDWRKGSLYEMAHDDVGLVVSGPGQVILESDPPHRLAYTWHTITPEWAAAVGMDEATAAATFRIWRVRLPFVNPRRGLEAGAVSELQGIARFKFDEGKLEEFKRLSAPCMEIVRTKDRGTLQYEIYFNDDQSEGIVLERYRDSEALIEHGANLRQPVGRNLCDGLLLRGWTKVIPSRRSILILPHPHRHGPKSRLCPSTSARLTPYQARAASVGDAAIRM